MDGTDNQPTAPASPDAPSSGASRADGPLKFDFKLRFGSNDEADAPASGNGSGELAQVPALDWTELTGVPSDQPKSYQTDGDLQSLIVQLANQIAGPDATGSPDVSVTASATIEHPRPATSGARPATLHHDAPTADPVPADPDTDHPADPAPPSLELRFAPVPPVPPLPAGAPPSAIATAVSATPAGGAAPSGRAAVPVHPGVTGKSVAAAAAAAVAADVSDPAAPAESLIAESLITESLIAEPVLAEPVAVEVESMSVAPPAPAEPPVVVAHPPQVLVAPDVVDPAVASVVAAVQADRATTAPSAAHS
ncbi:MAG: hypothetical protein F2534_06560, partial [Actinobacteria bacterium]|nr:hypothetical protein [Actinomycetota bacterium]